MRIGFITHYSKLGGANRSLLAMIDGLPESGSQSIEAHVALREDGPLIDELTARDIPYTVIPFPFSLHSMDAPFHWRVREALVHAWKRKQSLPRLTSIFRSWNVDLIHTNSLITDVGLHAAQRLKIPHVWHIREFGNRDYRLTPDWGWHHYVRKIARSDQVIAVSKALATHFRSYTSLPNLNVIYNGVVAKSQVSHVRERCDSRPIEAEAPLFMIIGGIQPEKGQGEAVRALAKLRESIPNARLAVVGNGDRKWIQRVIANENVDNAVECWGYVDDPWEAYAEADAVLVCSEAEGMGRVTVEAMIASTPVIGRDQAGTSELIDHGHTGRLFSNGAEGLAREMRWILSHPEETHRMVEAAWSKATSQFTFEEYASRVLKVWREVLKHR
jgi:glycosyltransferase involved in cell wall biosynthesis